MLALTPAKNIFGEDVSDQWKRKKQTPEEKRAAKKAKLDPVNWKTVKDVYDERSAAAAKKRKREVGEDVDGEQAQNVVDQLHPTAKRQKKVEKVPLPIEAIGERPLEEVMNKNSKKRHKKRQSQKTRNAELREQKEEAKAERKAKRELDGKQTPQSLKKQKIDDDRHKKTQDRKDTKATSTEDKTSTSKQSRSLAARVRPEDEDIEEDNNETDEDHSMPDVLSDAEEEQEPMVPVAQEVADESELHVEQDNDDVSQDGWEDASEQQAASTASSSEGIPEILSPPHDSASSSVSSVQLLQAKQNVPGQTEAQFAPSQPTQSEADREAARQRLQQQISQFRSQRKADDKPIRSRADLLEQRRRKEQERKAAKKEQRKKEKEEEARRQDQEIARRFSPGGSGSLLASPRSPMTEDGSNAFSFGRIAFEDGTQFDPSSGAAAAQKKHKGPADIASALKVAQAKEARVTGLDEQKKADIADKDMWLNARKRAHGERVKDDASLLKKALKRQEKQKSKSEKEWDNRIEGVRSSQEAKQKKRTENLQKRKDEKHSKNSGSKKIKRPGFEGSFRGRTGKGKKK